MNFEMLPYGNARGTTKVQCQHGPQECAFNMIEACGIKHLADPAAYFPFIFCVEKSDDSKSPSEVIEECIAETDKQEAISTCFGDGKGEEGVALIAVIAKKTQSLDHKYTPWVVVNGQHSEAAENNLEKSICEVYKGPNKPAACDKYAGDKHGMVWMDSGSLISLRTAAVVRATCPNPNITFLNGTLFV
eukprot:gnl/MRDRNA2_/MRDRNA2_112799_c0_seq1.p1 gnl/MRDRNA2_/MRDRNA2_112799_c0~~gnl/MRDRNA2_/MRDRNA2_112799_c0_seq1.p1  ORF type:complete len:189 (-),score=35.89 gnl/MRDRNA2_/MRDRNA2_112799_c0_seq1:188-754(-)